MVAVVVVLAATASAFLVGGGWSTPTPAPNIELTHSVLDDGETIAVTLQAGDAVETDQLYVMGSNDLDIGGSPGTSDAPDDAYASSREAFTESDDGTPQVGIGDTWDAGETVYLDPDGPTEGTTVRIYWNTRAIQNVNPGEVEGEESYKIAEFTV